MARTERKPRTASSKGTSTTARRYAVRSRSSDTVAQNGPARGSGTRAHEDAHDFSRYTGWRMLLNPLWCYHGFSICVLTLTVFGLVMVFSSSAVSMVAVGAAPWAQALNQSVYAIIGFVLFIVASAFPYRAYGRICYAAIGVALVLQALTFSPLGVEVGGNRGWIGVGSFTFQPAELVKLTLCITLPKMLTDIDERHPRGARRAFREYWRVLAVYLASLILVMGGKDLGTVMILLFIGLVAFMFSGFPGRWLKLGVLGGGVFVLLFVVTSANRMRRILAAYQGCSTGDMQDACYQSLHSRYAIASGGFLGVGLGNSREKWNYLPEAHNDFIYAIIGEETGFIGAFLVLLLFAVIAWCMTIIALRCPNRYVTVALLCFMIWIVGQALVNIAVVVGLLPVMGVPMPFISAGGSSLIMCLTAAGICVSMMRAQPQIRAERARA